MKLSVFFLTNVFMLYGLLTSELFSKNVIIAAEANDSFLLSEGKMKQSVLLMAEEKNGTQRKQLENNKKSNDQVLQICL